MFGQFYCCVYKHDGVWAPEKVEEFSFELLFNITSGIKSQLVVDFVIHSIPLSI